MLLLLPRIGSQVISEELRGVEDEHPTSLRLHWHALIDSQEPLELARGCVTLVPGLPVSGSVGRGKGEGEQDRAPEAGLQSVQRTTLCSVCAGPIEEACLPGPLAQCFVLVEKQRLRGTRNSVPVPVPFALCLCLCTFKDYDLTPATKLLPT